MPEHAPVAYWPDLGRQPNNVIMGCREASEQLDDCGIGDDGSCEGAGSCYRLESRKRAQSSPTPNGTLLPWPGHGPLQNHAVCYTTLSDLWAARGGAHSADKLLGVAYDDLTAAATTDPGRWQVWAVWTTGDVYAYSEDNMRLGASGPAVILLGRIATSEGERPFGDHELRNDDQHGLLWYAERCAGWERPPHWSPLREDD